MREPQRTARKKLSDLAAALADKRRLLILTHDNPDPDAIAGGWALSRVVQRLRRMKVDLAYGGIIGRGENRALADELRVPLQPIDALDLELYDAFALVDSQPETGNNSLPKGVLPSVVIDHHPLRSPTRDVPFHDVREGFGATVTIVAEYLRASRAVVGRPLATAIFYAIKAETQNLGRESSRADLRTFLRFFPLVDNQALSKIEHPRIPMEYFSMIDQAIDGTRLHGPVVVTRLGEVARPDAVAEFADLMVRVERVEWALAMGRYDQDLLISIRTNHPRGNAGRVIQQIVGSRGKAGGHGMMAGGKVPGGARSAAEGTRTEGWLEGRALRLLRSERDGVRLVARSALRPGRRGRT